MTNKRTCEALTEELLGDILSGYSLNKDTLYTLRINWRILKEVPGERITLCISARQKNQMCLLITSNLGLTYYVDEEEFRNSDLFSVLNIKEFSHEEESTPFYDKDFLQHLISCATVKVAKYNILVVEHNNLVEDEVSIDDLTLIDVEEKLEILKIELNTLTILIRASKKVQEHNTKWLIEKVESVESMIEQILRTYEQKYGEESLESLLDNEEYEFIEESSEDISSKCNCCNEEYYEEVCKKSVSELKTILADVISAVQQSESVGKYVNEVSSVLSFFGISDEEVKNQVKQAKQKANQLKEDFLKELLK